VIKQRVRGVDEAGNQPNAPGSQTVENLAFAHQNTRNINWPGDHRWAGCIKVALLFGILPKIPFLCGLILESMRMRNPCFTRFIFGSLLVFLIHSAAQAQVVVTDTLVKVKPASATQDTSRSIFKDIKYRLIGDGTFSRGNVNRTLMIVRAEISYTRPVLSLSTNPRFAFGQQNGMVAEREPYVDLFVDLYKKNKVYGFALGALEASNLRNITVRRMAGVGVGYRLLDREHHSLVFTNAINSEYTGFSRRDAIYVVRNSARLKGRHSFFKDRLRLNHVTFVQPALNLPNLRWNTLISLEMPLNKWVTFRTSFENAYESAVETGRKNNDTRVTFGIAIGNQH